MDPGIIIAIISAVFGGGSTLLGLLPHIKNVSVYSALHKALSDIESTKSSSRAFKKRIEAASEKTEMHWDHIVEWLDYGELIMAPLRRRITSRTIELTIIYLSSAAFISIDFKNIFLPKTTGSLEFFDVIILGITCFAPYISFLERFLLSEDEKFFLRNLNNLHDAFYMEFVKPSLLDFNLEFENFFKDYRKSYREEIQYLKRMNKDLKMKLDDLERQLEKFE